MPRFETSYSISFDFTIRFFALDTEDPDEIADDIVESMFGAQIFSAMEQATGSGSGTTLSGQDVTGDNYEYVYKLHVPVGNVTDTDFKNISADDAAAALAKLRQEAARTVSQTGMPIDLHYLQQI